MFKELGRFAYHIQVAQRLTEMDERARLQYCSRVLSMTYVRREGTHLDMNCINYVSVFQCQPTALLRASGSMQGG